MPSPVPLVSVLMPVYNAMPYLQEALDSILTQTWENFELIIIDDGSQDHSSDLMDTYALRDPRIRLFHREHHGLIPSLQYASNVSCGTYLARMDADDICDPDRLLTQIRILNSNPETSVVSCTAATIDENGYTTGILAPHWSDDMLLELAVSNTLVHGSILMRRSDFESVGGYQKAPEDYDLWIRLAKAGKAFALASRPDGAPLYFFRSHQQRYSLIARHSQSEAILRIQLPLLRQCTRTYWGMHPRRPLPTASHKKLGKLIEGWGRVGGAAVLCRRIRIVSNAIRWLLGLSAPYHLTTLDQDSCQQIASRLKTANDALIWSGISFTAALRLRSRQWRIAPWKAENWRDVALCIPGVDPLIRWIRDR